MLGTMFSKGAIPVLERVLSFTEQRHSVIVSNIANVNTPGYRARDLNMSAFKSSLRDAIDRRREENPRRFFMRGSRDIMVGFRGRVRGRALLRHGHESDILRHDKNDVSLEREMVALAKNTAKHNGAANLLAKKYSMLEAAIRLRP